MKSNLSNVQVITVLILSLYVIGIFFPSLFWTTHFLSFFHPLISFGCLAIAFYVLLRSNSTSLHLDLSSNIIVGLITLVSGYIFHSFPILHDQYGDSYKFISFLTKTANTIPDSAREALFRFSIGPSDGQDTVLAIVTYISHYANISYGNAFLWIGVVCGSLFILSSLLFIRFMVKDAQAQLLLTLAVCCAPFLLIFFGHQEIYAPILLVHFIWLMLLVFYYTVRSEATFFLLILLYLICLKLHSIAVLYLPSLLLTIVYHYAPKSKGIKKLLSIRGLLTWVVLPITVIGIIVYFFVLEDHKDPRTLRVTVSGLERLFLPLFSPAPPLDRYNLFSINHIFDYLILPFLWSPIAILLVIFFISTFRKTINWTNPAILLIGLILLLNVLLFFVTNPLLTMPFDWDLFSLPALSLLVFVIILVQQTENINYSFGKLTSSVVSLTLVTLPFFAIHSNTSLLSKRYEVLGMRVYETYYEWSFKKIEYAISIDDQNINNQIERRFNIIQKLRPDAIKGIDPEFAQLLTTQGRQVLRHQKNAKDAIKLFSESEEYNPNFTNNVMLHMEALFELKRYNEALEKAFILVERKFPSEEKSISIAIHCSLKAKEYESAKQVCAEYLSNWQDPTILEIYTRLQKNQEIESLYLLFEEKN